MVFCFDNSIGLRKHLWAGLFGMLPERTPVMWVTLLHRLRVLDGIQGERVASYWVFLSAVRLGAGMAATLFLPGHSETCLDQGLKQNSLCPPKNLPRSFLTAIKNGQ